MRSFMLGYYEPGAAVYHTDNDCPTGGDIPEDRRREGVVRGLGMERCTTCDAIGKLDKAQRTRFRCQNMQAGN